MDFRRYHVIVAGASLSHFKAVATQECTTDRTLNFLGGNLQPAADPMNRLGYLIVAKSGELAASSKIVAQDAKSAVGDRIDPIVDAGFTFVQYL